MLDLLIYGGMFPDFDRGEILSMNIGIKDGAIYYLGDEKPRAKEQLNATGLIVSPGFIDIHMHEEDFVGEGKQFFISKGMLEMGVTTAVGGNCGVMYQDVKTFKTILEELGGAPINYMLLSGYNFYRSKGLSNYNEPVTQEALDLAKEKIKKDLSEGAVGISFGIEYDPSITTEEIIEVAKLATDPHHLVSAHYREDGSRAIEAIEEMIDISNAIDAKFQIAHLSSCSAMGKMKEALPLIHEAMEENPKLNYDTYPYNAFSTRLGSAVFADGCLDDWGGKKYSDILLTAEPYKNQRCDEELFRKARQEYPDMLAVAFAMNEDEIQMAVADDKGMIASDGIISNGLGHPRAQGTFPRVLGKYVREEKVLPLILALEKMTKAPAKRLNQDKKGEIKIGYDADLTLFDPETIIDQADFTEMKSPKGIHHVFIKGKPALTLGTIVNEHLGTFIPFKSS